MNSGKNSSKKRAANMQGNESVKKSKDDECDEDLEWTVININVPHGSEENEHTAIKSDEEIIDYSYAYINNDPAGIHLTLLDGHNYIKVFDCKDENNIKTWRHKLEEPYDSCFIHNDSQSAILIRQYLGQEKREQNDIVIDEVKNFLSSDSKIERNTLFRYNIPDNTEKIFYEAFRYRKYGNVLIVVMKQITPTGIHLMIVILNLSTKMQEVWHDPDDVDDILYVGEHYVVAIVVSEEGKIIKSLKLGDGQIPTKIIGKYKMKSRREIYKIFLPQESSADEICIDSYGLKKREGSDNIIQKWGETEGGIFATCMADTKKNVFVLHKNKRLTIIGDENEIVMAGYCDNPILRSYPKILLMKEYGFANEVVTCNDGDERHDILIYDAEKLQQRAHIDLSSCIWNVYWNSERSSFIAVDSVFDYELCSICKQVPKNLAK